MTGQCYSCGAQFGVFKKEHGCKNCGFSFCNKCLNEKAVNVPKRNNSKHHVCHKCFKLLTGQVKEDAANRSYDLPEAYVKRMAALEERASRSGVKAGASNAANRGSSSQEIPKHLRNLDKPDRDIAMRLEKLKEDRQPKVKSSDSDLHARLAQLKGVAHDAQTKPVYHPPDRRTEVEQVDDLLEQLTSEVAIDALRPDPVAVVESKLAHLRQETDPKTGKPKVDNNNMDQLSKDGGSATTCDTSHGNDLSQVDKMGPFSAPYSKNIEGNFGDANSEGSGSQAAGGVDPAEMQRLMAQATRELEEDARRQVAGRHRDQGIVNRLQDLTGTSTHPELVRVEREVSDEENDEAEASRVLQQFLEEAKIDEKASNIPQSRRKKKANTKGRGSPEPANIKPPREKDFDSDSDYDDSDELPYCCLCTEDATIRCRDCDLDLFCNRCFRESHKEMDILDHRTTPYKVPKSYR